MALAPDLHALGTDLLDGTTPADLERLRACGYLLLAVPVEFGGLGGNVAQVCHQQRLLARRAPGLARSLTTHLAWTGAAAEQWSAATPALAGLLESAAEGAFFSDPPPGPEPGAFRRWRTLLLAATADPPTGEGRR